MQLQTRRIGLSTILAVFVTTGGCLAMGASFAQLTSLYETQPEGCSHVIKPGWLWTSSGLISDAVSTAQDGDRICIASGEYKDAITITKPLEIIGYGETPPQIISETAQDVVQWHAPGGKIENLYLTQIDGEPSGSRVTGQNGTTVFRAGQPDYFSQDAHSGFTVVNARVSLNNMHIRNDVYSGIYVLGPEANVQITGSIISENAEAGILAIDRAVISLTNSIIRDNRREGVRLDTGASFQARDFSLSGSGYSGVFTQNGASFDIADARLSDGKAGGIVMGHRSGPGKLSDSHISGYKDGLAGIAMRGGENLTLDRMQVSGNSRGVSCLPVLNGPGSPALNLVITNAEISENDTDGVDASGACNVQIQNSLITKNRDRGINNGGVLHVSGTKITRNGSGGYHSAGVVTGAVSEIVMRDTLVSENAGNGMILAAGASVDIRDVVVSGHPEAGLSIPLQREHQWNSRPIQLERFLAQHQRNGLSEDMTFQSVIFSQNIGGA